MKQICGFKGLNGHFYEKEKDCKKADLEYKIEDISSKLNDFDRTLGHYLWKQRSSHMDGISERYILNIVSKLVLYESDMFIEVINKSKDLKKELDELYKLKKSSSIWWLQLKWW